MPIQTITVGPWPSGINNRAPDYAVPVECVRNAVNMDVDNSGRYRSRAGVIKHLSAPGSHSAFACPLGIFFVQAGQIKKFNTDNTATLIGTVGDTPMCWEYANGEVFWSNTNSVGRIKADLTLGAWGESSAPDNTDFTNADYDKYPTFYSGPLPCSIIKYFAGRLFMAVDNIVYYTERWKLHRIFFQDNYITLPDEVRIIAQASDGLWIATSKAHYWYPGLNPRQFVPSQRLDYGATARTHVVIPNSSDSLWRSDRGIILAGDSGQIQNLTEKHVATNPASTGAALIREQNGLRQFITSAVPDHTSPFINTSWAASEAVRRAS